MKRRPSRFAVMLGGRVVASGAAADPGREPEHERQGPRSVWSPRGFHQTARQGPRGFRPGRDRRAFRQLGQDGLRVRVRLLLLATVGVGRQLSALHVSGYRLGLT
jgi:hypothetical protein